MLRTLAIFLCILLVSGCIETYLDPKPDDFPNRPPPAPLPGQISVIAFSFTVHQTFDGRDDCIECQGKTFADGQKAIEIWDRIKPNFPFLINVIDGPTEFDAKPKPIVRNSLPSDDDDPPLPPKPPVYRWTDRSTTVNAIMKLKPSYILHLHTEINVEGASQSAFSVLSAGILPGRIETTRTVEATLTLPDGKTVVARGESESNLLQKCWLPFIFIAPFNSPSLKQFNAFYEQPYTDALNQLSNQFRDYLAKNPPKAEPPAQPASQPPAQPAAPVTQ